MPEGFDPALFAALFAAEDRHFWYGARNLALKTVIQGLASQLPANYHVLEVGCGTGNTLRMLKEACPSAGIIVGMDLFDEGLQYARRRVQVPLVRGHVDRAPFSVPFDIVGLFDVLEHIEDDASSLKQIRMLLKPGGYLILTVPARKKLWSRFDEEAHHCRRYESHELRERLMDAGFRVDYLTPFMAALYPLARVARWTTGRTNAVRHRMGIVQKSPVLTDLTVRPGLNEILGFVLKREAGALRKRRRLPIGTSLLAVARA